MQTQALLFMRLGGVKLGGVGKEAVGRFKRMRATVLELCASQMIRGLPINVSALSIRVAQTGQMRRLKPNRAKCWVRMAGMRRTHPMRSRATPSGVETCVRRGSGGLQRVAPTTHRLPAVIPAGSVTPAHIPSG